MTARGWSLLKSPEKSSKNEARSDSKSLTMRPMEGTPPRSLWVSMASCTPLRVSVAKGASFPERGRTVATKN